MYGLNNIQYEMRTKIIVDIVNVMVHERHETFSFDCVTVNLNRSGRLVKLVFRIREFISQANT